MQKSLSQLFYTNIFECGVRTQLGSLQHRTGNRTFLKRGIDTDHTWGKDRRWKCKCALHIGRKLGGRGGRSEQQPAAAHFHLKGQT